MSTDIHWHDGDTITARCLPADHNGPALNIIRLNPETRWEVTIFPDLEFAKAMRAALDALYPLPGDESAPSGESEQSWKATIRYAEEHASEREMSAFAQMAFDTASDLNRVYLAGMRAGGAQ